MPNYTSNLKLEKPLVTDNYDINVSNGNMDKIDLEVKKLQDNKSNNGHTHTKANITDFAHTHSMGEITGLSLEWDAIKNKPISSSITSTSTTDIANSNSVKLVNDKVEANKTSILSHSTSIANHNTLITNNSNEIESLKQSVSSGKTLVANAITGKGVPTLATDTFSTMANNIGSIATGKKWAEGTQNADGNGDVNISGLDFRPSCVIAYNYVNSYVINGGFYSEHVTGNLTQVVLWKNNNPSGYEIYTKSVSISDGGFSIKCGRAWNRECKWVAYE